MRPGSVAQSVTSGASTRWRVKQAVHKSRQSDTTLPSSEQNQRNTKVNWGSLDIERVTFRFTKTGEVRYGLVCLYYNNLIKNICTTYVEKGNLQKLGH